MWRVGVLVRSHQRRVPGRLMMAQWSDSEQVSHLASSRHFSGRNEDDMEDLDAEKQKAKSFSASDMEFYNPDDFDDEDDEDEDEAARLDEENRRKQEEIQRELDTRTGRPWTDPWKITEEQWMSTTTYEDLTDWSPEYVSRISQERVKIHPGRFSV
jgi:hypothetical protein